MSANTCKGKGASGFIVCKNENRILPIHDAQQGCRDATYEPSRFPVAVPYCKSVLDDVMALVDTDSDLKVVFKEFPILGPESVVATRVSLAVQEVSSKLYADFHRALMRQPGRITEESALRLAESVGAGPAAVKTALADPNIGERIRSNQNLAEKLGIRGTPAFVVGDRILPGAVGKDALLRAVEEVRKAS